MFDSIYDTLISGQRWLLLLQGLGVTIYIAIVAIILGTILGAVFALFKISKNPVLRIVAEIYTTVIRGIPLATQLMIFYFVVFAPLGLDRVLVATLAYGINSGAYCTEIFRAGIQGVDSGQMEAGRSLAELLADSYNDNFSAGSKSCSSYLHKRIHSSYKRNFRGKLYCSYGSYKSRRHDPQRHLQRLDSASFVRPYIPLPYAWAYKAVFDS